MTLSSVLSVSSLLHHAEGRQRRVTITPSVEQRRNGGNGGKPFRLSTTKPPDAAKAPGGSEEMCG